MTLTACGGGDTREPTGRENFLGLDGTYTCSADPVSSATAPLHLSITAEFTSSSVTVKGDKVKTLTRWLVVPSATGYYEDSAQLDTVIYVQPDRSMLYVEGEITDLQTLRIVNAIPSAWICTKTSSG